MKHKLFFRLLPVFLLAGTVVNAPAQGTAFYYQGRLNDGGSAANGAYDLRFAIYDAVTNGNAISYPLTNFSTSVSSGLFTATLDFGAVFTGTNYWLDLGVRPGGSTNAFTILVPRQALLPAPYAVFAAGAGNLLGTLPATQISGALPSAQLAGTYSGTVIFTNGGDSFAGTFYGNGTNLTGLNGSQVTGGTVADARLSTNVALLNRSQVFSGTNTFTGSNNFAGANSFTNAGNSFTGTFSGNGTNLVNLNGSQVTGGTVADARLSTNVALLNGGQTFTGANNFTGVSNSFTGSFFGNGLVGWIPVSVTATQAVRDTGYLLLGSSLTTVTLPPSASLLAGDIVRISGAGSGGWKVAQNAGQSITGIFLSPSNSAWVAANASSIGWQTIASSADGVKMAAAAGGGGGIFTSTDAGATWNSSSSTYSPLSLASSADGTHLVGAINGGTIVISTNSGGTWNVTTAPGSTAWTCVAASADGSRLAAVNSGGGIYTSVDGGSNWAARLTDGGTLTAIASSADGTKLVAVANGGRISTSVNAGTNWTTQGGSITANWLSVASSADGTKLAAVVNGGGIYTSPDAGVTWTLQASAPTNYWYHITSSADGGRLAAVASPGGIYVSANYGVTWVGQTVASQNWRGIAGSADGTKLAAVYNVTTTTGAIYYSQATAANTTSTTGVSGGISGGAGAAVELQYLGGGVFMPISSMGIFWAN